MIVLLNFGAEKYGWSYEYTKHLPLKVVLLYLRQYLYEQNLASPEPKAMWTLSDKQLVDELDAKKKKKNI